MKNIVINGITYNNVSNVIFNTDTGEQASYKEESEIDNGGDATQTVTPLRYFNVSNGTIYGLSDEGYNAHYNGELTEIVLPKTYSLELGGSVTEILPDLDIMGIYFEVNAVGYPCEINGVTFNSIEEIAEQIELGNIMFPVTLTYTQSSAVEGSDYAIHTINNLGGIHNVEKITIPNTITSIGAAAFCGNTSLSSVVFEEGTYITEIGDDIFNDCTALSKITLPEGITRIPQRAFYRVCSLREIKIPDSVIEIGLAAFGECHNLTTVVFGEESQLMYLTEGGAFSDCHRLVDVTIPKNVVEINDSTFFQCYVGVLTVKAVNPPVLNAMFNAEIHTVYVPAESVDAYKNATNWSAYADIIQGI